MRPMPTILRPTKPWPGLLLCIVASGFLVGCYRTQGSVREERRADKVENSSASEYADNQQLDTVTGPLPAMYWSIDRMVEFGRLAQSYLGSPYNSGTNYQIGVDCSRLVAELFRRFERVELPSVAREQARLGQPVTQAKLRIGDLVFFAIDGSVVSHVGVYVGDGRFLHASTSRGVVIDRLGDRYWRKHWWGARRIMITVSDRRAERGEK